MAQVSAPFGLRVAKGQGGPVTRIPERIIVPAADATAANIPTIGAGDPVYIDTNGRLQKTAAGVGAGITTSCIGTFQGVEYSDSSGKRTVSNWWSAPAVYANSEVWFWFSSDTSGATIYEIQTNATILQSAVGQNFGVSYSTGTFNNVVGFSNATLDVSTGGTTGPFQLWGLAYDPNIAATGANNGYAPGTPTGGVNAWGDPFVNVYVKLSKAQYAAPVTGF